MPGEYHTQLDQTGAETEDKHVSKVVDENYEQVNDEEDDDNKSRTSEESEQGLAGFRSQMLENLGLQTLLIQLGIGAYGQYGPHNDIPIASSPVASPSPPPPHISPVMSPSTMDEWRDFIQGLGADDLIPLQLPPAELDVDGGAQFGVDENLPLEPNPYISGRLHHEVLFSSHDDTQSSVPVLHAPHPQNVHAAGGIRSRMGLAIHPPMVLNIQGNTSGTPWITDGPPAVETRCFSTQISSSGILPSFDTLGTGYQSQEASQQKKFESTPTRENADMDSPPPPPPRTQRYTRLPVASRPTSPRLPEGILRRVQLPSAETETREVSVNPVQHNTAQLGELLRSFNTNPLEDPLGIGPPEWTGGVPLPTRTHYSTSPSDAEISGASSFSLTDSVGTDSLASADSMETNRGSVASASASDSGSVDDAKKDEQSEIGGANSLKGKMKAGMRGGAAPKLNTLRGSPELREYCLGGRSTNCPRFRPSVFKQTSVYSSLKVKCSLPPETKKYTVPKPTPLPSLLARVSGASSSKEVGGDTQRILPTLYLTSRESKDQTRGSCDQHGDRHDNILGDLVENLPSNLPQNTEKSLSTISSPQNSNQWLSAPKFKGETNIPTPPRSWRPPNRNSPSRIPIRCHILTGGHNLAHQRGANPRPVPDILGLDKISTSPTAQKPEQQYSADDLDLLDTPEENFSSDHHIARRRCANPTIFMRHLLGLVNQPTSPTVQEPEQQSSADDLNLLDTPEENRQFASRSLPTTLRRIKRRKRETEESLRIWHLRQLYLAKVNQAYENEDTDENDDDEGDAGATRGEQYASFI